MKIDVYPEYKITNVLFSGGMDSTILLYLLAKQIHQHGYDIKIVCCTFTSSINKKNLIPIIEYINNKFSVDIKLVKIKKLQWIRDIVKNLLEIYDGVVYSGCNKVITDKFTPTKYIPNDTPPVRGPAYNERHLRPFINMDKVELMSIYIEEDILDLLKLTHSCGTKTHVHCGECYFCMERIWAANSLNIRDINWVQK
jgi:7-cyano-7-deazaguanine synthase in queuosine biosynthesis